MRQHIQTEVPTFHQAKQSALSLSLLCGQTSLMNIQQEWNGKDEATLSHS